MKSFLLVHVLHLPSSAPTSITPKIMAITGSLYLFGEVMYVTSWPGAKKSV